MRVGILFTSFGPYHVARMRALQASLQREGGELFAARFAAGSQLYAWDQPALKGLNVTTLTESEGAEECSYRQLLIQWIRWLRIRKIEIVLLPSYSPLRNLLCVLTAKMLGVRCVLMSESWGATSSTKRLVNLARKGLLRLFHSALVGGTPHRKHYISQGMEPHAVFTGYDAIDNDYFVTASDRARAEAEAERRRLRLPTRYFLNLGRMVPKKNLELLLTAYSLFVRTHPQARENLVLVGSGPMREELLERAQLLFLNVCLHDAGSDSAICPESPGTVHFVNFQQIDQNPIYYGLASAFILPSRHEEWGLVVNEAMACSLPVLVSSNAGCAHDLVEHGINGFHFDPMDADGLATHLGAISMSPHRGTQMGQESRKKIDQWSCATFADNALAAILVARVK